jgi:hypothetical protein
MQTDIQTIFSELLAKMPQKLGDSDFIFDAQNLPILADNALETDKIAFKRSWHTYNDVYKIEHFHVSATPKMYQILGLTMICAVFQNKKVSVNLTNAHSFIKKLEIDGCAENRVGLTEKPTRFHYYPNELRGKNPYYGLDSSFFPGVFLTSESGIYTDKDWDARNTLFFSQNNKTLTQLAAVFLDFGNPNNRQDELVFEGHAGNCCLRPMSVEFSCWLPDSLGWFDAAFL